MNQRLKELMTKGATANPNALLIPRKTLERFLKGEGFNNQQVGTAAGALISAIEALTRERENVTREALLGAVRDTCKRLGMHPVACERLPELLLGTIEKENTTNKAAKETAMSSNQRTVTMTFEQLVTHLMSEGYSVDAAFDEAGRLVKAGVPVPNEKTNVRTVDTAVMRTMREFAEAHPNAHATRQNLTAYFLNRGHDEASARLGAKNVADQLGLA